MTDIFVVAAGSRMVSIWFDQQTRLFYLMACGKGTILDWPKNGFGWLIVLFVLTHDLS